MPSSAGILTAPSSRAAFPTAPGLETTRLIRGVSFELNNSLAAIVSTAEALLVECDPRVRREGLELILAEAHCSARLAADLGACGATASGLSAPLGLNGLVRKAIELSTGEMCSAGIRVKSDLAEALPAVSGDYHRLLQVLLNLIANARDVLEAHGCSARGREIRLSTRANSRTVEIRVEDTGPGVPLEIRQRIFEPFFSTKSAGAGAGLGLSVAAGILREHRGTLTVTEGDLGGACFVLALPSCREVTAEADAATRERPATPFCSVLIVDDKPEVQKALSRLLASRGHKPETAHSASEALDLIARRRYEVVISDYAMPDMDGAELLARIGERIAPPRPAVVLMSGKSRRDIPGSHIFLAKPFSAGELWQAIADARACAS